MFLFILVKTKVVILHLHFLERGGSYRPFSSSSCLFLLHQTMYVGSLKRVRTHICMRDLGGGGGGGKCFQCCPFQIDQYVQCLCHVFLIYLRPQAVHSM